MAEEAGAGTALNATPTPPLSQATTALHLPASAPHELFLGSANTSPELLPIVPPATASKGRPSPLHFSAATPPGTQPLVSPWRPAEPPVRPPRVLRLRTEVVDAREGRHPGLLTQRTPPGELLEAADLSLSEVATPLPGSERVCAADAVPKGPCYAAAGAPRYSELAPLWKPLCDGSVVMLKGSWLVQWCRGGGILPRRQELPPDAMWDADELWCSYQTWSNHVPPRIVVVSHCWLAGHHPDPDGLQLDLLAGALEHSHSREDRGSDTAVFYDWCSLPQKPRTEEEHLVYEQGLGHLDVFYAHSRTEVVLLTRVPHGVQGYWERGWPCLEVALTRLRQPGSAAVAFDLGRMAGDDAAATADWWRPDGDAAVAVGLPSTVEAFVEELAGKAFEDDADLERACGVYERAFEEALGSAEVLDYQGLGFTLEQAKVLAPALRHCANLRRFDVSDNERLGSAGVAVLVEALPGCCETGGGLEALGLRHVGLNDDGTRQLTQELPRCRSLRELDLQGNHIGDQGAQWLASAVTSCARLQRLSLVGNPIGSTGGKLLKQAWSWAAWSASVGQELCQLMVDLGSDQVECQAAAVLRLRRFTERCVKNRFALARAGGVPPLVALLSSDDAGLQEHAAATLRSLCSNTGTLGALIRDADGVRPLVEMLRSPSGEVRAEAVGALRNLGENDSRSNAMIVYAEGVVPVVQLIGSEATELRDQAIGIIDNLAATDGINDAIVASGVIPPIVALLRSDVQAVQEQATSMLWSLASLPEGIIAIAEAGGIPPLVGLLHAQSSELAAWASATLRNLSTDSESARTIARSGGVQPLVELLASDDAKLQEHAAGTLWNLTAESNVIKQKVMEAGGIPLLIELLSSTDTEVQHQATGALRNLAAGVNECKAAIAQSGGAAPLIALLDSDSAPVREQAVGALRNICRAGDETKVAIMKAGGVRPLVRMCGLADAAIREQAAGALRNLSTSADVRAEIAKATRDSALTEGIRV